MLIIFWIKRVNLFRLVRDSENISFLCIKGSQDLISYSHFKIPNFSCKSLWTVHVCHQFLQYFEGFFLGTFRTNFWELNFLRMKMLILHVMCYQS